MDLKKWKGKLIAFDLDLTLTTDCVEDYEDLNIKQQRIAFSKLKPDEEMIDLLNHLSENNTVYIYTSRSDLLQDVTYKWLKDNNVNCDYFRMGKPGYDLFIDDKAMNVSDFK